MLIYTCYAIKWMLINLGSALNSIGYAYKWRKVINGRGFCNKHRGKH